jgi:hypothetical protein
MHVFKYMNRIYIKNLEFPNIYMKCLRRLDFSPMNAKRTLLYSHVDAQRILDNMRHKTCITNN